MNIEKQIMQTKNSKVKLKSLTLEFGALKGTRTPDPLLRRQMLYPAELSAQNISSPVSDDSNYNTYGENNQGKNILICAFLQRII